MKITRKQARELKKEDFSFDQSVYTIGRTWKTKRYFSFRITNTYDKKWTVSSQPRHYEYLIYKEFDSFSDAKKYFLQYLR